MYTRICVRALYTHIRQMQLKTLLPQNLPIREILIPRYLTVQNQIGILVLFEFVPRNLSFSIGWMSGVWHFRWKLSYVHVFFRECAGSVLVVAFFYGLTQIE